MVRTNTTPPNLPYSRGGKRRSEGLQIKPFTNKGFYGILRSMNTFLSNHWLKLLAIVLLLGALGSFPFVYYQIMNWVVVAAALVTVQQAYQRNMTALGWVFALVAVVFNPLAPLYLRADVWRIADVAAAVLFVISFAFITAKKQPQVRTA